MQKSFSNHLNIFEKIDHLDNNNNIYVHRCMASITNKREMYDKTSTKALGIGKASGCYKGFTFYVKWYSIT